ncbi:MAG: chemotaxis protein CheR [Myxococcaceae bacterium]|jgi:chemotaxis protein methyltransferase CheR|nr:chemotaxis protein CheR [Myxococcaceae bacterium]
MEGLEPLFSLVTRRSGSALSRQQRERVAEAARPLLEGRTALELVAHLDGREGARDLLTLLSAASVHKTDLFRDEGQLEALEHHVLAPLVREGRPLELWSAGCATGEEVATLLLLLARVGAHPDSRVLGTDLSSLALARARTLAFSAEAMRRVPGPLAAQHFEREGEVFRLSQRLAGRARFLQHNLMETPYPFAEAARGFDVIMCRNVLIYFTPEAAERTVGALAERLAPSGTLVLSAAEPILKPRADLETVRVGGTFFYAPRRPGLPRPPIEALPPPRPSAPVPPVAKAPPPPRDEPVATSPEQEGEALFSLVMEWAAAGQGDAQTEAGLRKALYLAPDLAAARYCLALLLDQQGLRADAATEYRRALAVLESGRARATPFFLNPERLAAACRRALERRDRVSGVTRADAG